MARLLSALAFAAALGSAAAQDKQPPKPVKIAINDPEKLKEDKAFALQGEYEGQIVLNEGPRKLGVQVVARANGEFVGKLLHGGLPGAGWDGNAATEFTAKMNEDGSATVAGKNLSGTITGATMSIKDGMKIDTTLKKVTRTSPTIGAKPPEGALVLFDKPGDEAANWNGGKIVELSDGKFLGTGIKTKQKFGAFKLHAEFRLPFMPNSTGQGRGNSGVYLQDRYEIQVLDSFGLKGENNECGGIYTMYKPGVNMCLPPMAWQTYDIDFTPATFDGDTKTGDAKVTVVHNGVKIHDAVSIKKSTGGGQDEKPTHGPIQLQNHGDPLVFRNVWIVEGK